MAKIGKKEIEEQFNKILSKSGIETPFPEDLQELKKMPPIKIRWRYKADYIHSFGQDSPFFLGIKHKKLLGTKCPHCGYTYATPRLHCMYCGEECDWFELPKRGYIHTATVSHLASEAFLKETPFVLIMVEWPGVNTLFLSRLKGVDPLNLIPVDLIGTEVEIRFKRKRKNSKTVSTADVYFVPVKKKQGLREVKQ